jgi:hypothetical protein
MQYTRINRYVRTSFSNLPVLLLKKSLTLGKFDMSKCAGGRSAHPQIQIAWDRGAMLTSHLTNRFGGALHRKGMSLALIRYTLVRSASNMLPSPTRKANAK